MNGQYYPQSYMQGYPRQQYPYMSPQQYPMQQPVQPQQAQQMTDEKIYVQGPDAAKAYLVAANSSVRLWDSTQPVFYEKWADATGRPSLMAYKYEAVDLTEKPVSLQGNISDYEKRLAGIEERLNRLEGGMQNEQPDANVK